MSVIISIFTCLITTLMNKYIQWKTNIIALSARSFIVGTHNRFQTEPQHIYNSRKYTFFWENQCCAHVCVCKETILTFWLVPAQWFSWFYFLFVANAVYSTWSMLDLICIYYAHLVYMWPTLALGVYRKCWSMCHANNACSIFSWA